MPTSATGTLSDSAGFTLIELVVVIALLALFSSISLPLLMDRGEGDDRRALRRLSGTVKQLYNEATLTRDQHQLSFDIDRNRVLAFRLRSRLGQVEKQPFGRELSLGPLQLREVEVAGRGSFRSGEVLVSIFPLGWMEQTRLALVDDSGRTRLVDFSPLTGTTKIADERPLLP